MICKVEKTLEKYSLLENVKSVAVGVSGGADSMCLLDILSSLKVKYGIIIKAVHLNHNLRGQEALRDENLVRAFCKEKGIELLVFSEDVRFKAKEMGVGEEECGRILRYECFEKAQCDAAATAHTLSDSAETLIFNLIRGTGSKGLCGIPCKREPNIIRPLIECTRQEVETYCFENAVPFVTDSSNLTDEYKRNFIRHNIIPAFEKVNPAFYESMSRTAEILKEENDFMEESARNLLKESESEKGYSLSPFQKAHSAVCKRAIALLISDCLKKQPEKRHISLVFSAVEKGKGKIKLSDDLYLSVKDSIISFCGEEKQTEVWETVFESGKAHTPYGVYEITEQSRITDDCFDKDKITGELILSSRKEGDSFTFKKRKVTKSLKKLWNEMKIPLSERNKIAVLHDGERVVWAEGIGTNAFYMPDENTNKIYKIKKGRSKL